MISRNPLLANRMGAYSKGCDEYVSLPIDEAWVH